MKAAMLLLSRKVILEKVCFFGAQRRRHQQLVRSRGDKLKNLKKRQCFFPLFFFSLWIRLQVRLLNTSVGDEMYFFLSVEN